MSKEVIKYVKCFFSYIVITNKCFKTKKATSRVFEANKELYKYKQNAKTNLLSVKGIETRVNRSSKVECVFGIIKQDMNYERIRRRGLQKVSAEIMLVCLGYVIRKHLVLLMAQETLNIGRRLKA